MDEILIIPKLQGCQTSIWHSYVVLIIKSVRKNLAPRSPHYKCALPPNASQAFFFLSMILVLLFFIIIGKLTMLVNMCDQDHLNYQCTSLPSFYKTLIQ